jgi:hypothetical protein
MVFQICATSFSNPAGAKSAGYIDCVVEAGSGCVQPPGGFITACHGQGMGALMQNSDSGSGGCSDTSYLSGLASAGLDAVGGESEGGAEIDAIMQYLPFMNYGGEGTGGTTGNNCVWSSCGGNDGASVGKYGCSTFLETYTTDSMLSASEIGQEAGMNYDAGCFEVGILVGSWSYGDYGAGVSTYQEMVDEIASQSKKPCVGFQWWYVEGDGSGAPSNDSGGVMAGLMSAYGKNMTPIYDRKKGVTPTPPSPSPSPSPSPVFQKGTYFQGYINQIDIAPALAAAHNGQPTRGVHVIDFWPVTGSSSTVGITYTARPRELQSGYRQFQQ